MTFLLADRVRESCSSPGTGTATLLGAALGYRTFSAGVGASNTTYYVIADQSGANWEVGYGTVGAGGTTLARTTVLSSSNAGSLVNFSSGTQDVWVDYPATKAVSLDSSSKLSFGGNGTGYADWASAAPTVAAGRMWYDGTTGSWNLGMGGGNITQQVGEELFVYGKASAAITDSPLQIIKQTGVVGSSGVITFAPAGSGVANGDLILGVATESIALNGFGRITAFGVVRGITTNGTAFGETWADGDEIWYNPVTGNPTNVKPIAPNIKVSVGVILNAGSGGSGSIQVEVAHGSMLGGTDSNVQLTSPTGGQILTYNQTGAYWSNVTLGAGTGFAATPTTGGALSIGASVAAIGTWMGTPSSANLLAAMTDETGTGSLVFATSPTLVTPLLGTPTSGNLSNCTNIPAGQLTGTIPSGVLGNSTLYIGTTAIALNRASANLALTGLLSETYQGATSGSIQLIPAAVAGTGTVLTMPATTGTIITSGDSATVTNTMLAGSIANAKLLNSSVTFNGVSVALGASGTITATATNALTIGTGLSGTSYNGSAAVTIANTGILSITGTAPVSASTTSGATTISMAAANTTTNGYLTSTDWNTFNNKSNTTGTVTSIATAGTVSGLTLTGGTITTTGTITLGGTLAVTASNFSSQVANTFLSAPNGAAGVPTFRAIVAADIPTLNQNTTGTAANVTGTVALGNGGSGQTTAQAAMNAFAGAVTSGSYLRGNGTNVVMSTIQAADVPTLNQNTTGSSGSCTGNAATATTATTANAVNTANNYQMNALGVGVANTTAGTIVASGNITAFSDETLKKNWRPVQENFVSKLAKIKSGVYDRIDMDATQAGVSAQSLKALLPEVIDGDNILSVAYGNAAMVSCVELAKVIEELRAEIAILKGR